MAKKNKITIRLSKKALKKAAKIGIALFIILLISCGIYLLVEEYGKRQWAQTSAERNLYCNTTWQDYINNEVVIQMTEYNATNCRCTYENHYTMDELLPVCICSCDLYYLNGTLITNNFKPLFSAIK